MTGAQDARLLAGRIAVVTGGAGAIGGAIGRSMAAHGADVVIADVDESSASRLAEELAARSGVRTMGVAADVTDADALEAAADRIEAELGTVDIVVANAGLLSAQPAVEMSPDRWRGILDVNLTGAFLTATVFARRLQRARRPGSIIFSSSLFGLRGGRGNAAYSASKFGIIGLMQSLAAELAGDGIRVNAVCPGQIESPMIGELFARRAEATGRTAAEERRTFTERIPAGRLGTPDDVAKAFVYLASDLSEYVTGHPLLVDGGWQVG